MILAVVALIGLSQFQTSVLNDFGLPVGGQSFASPAITGRTFYYGARINMRSPLSSSVLVAQAFHAGRLRLPFIWRPQIGPDVLNCSPVPCTTPNKQASEGGAPVNETPIAVDPNNHKHLLTGGNDYNCSASTQGFFASSNGGTSWNHTCMGTLPGQSGLGDPGVAYDLNHTAFISGIDSPGVRRGISCMRNRQITALAGPLRPSRSPASAIH